MIESNRTKRLAVTEILIGFAIVAVLSVILVPVLAARRPLSRKELFLANLKQVVGSTLQYTADNNGTLPLAFSRRTDTSWRWNSFIAIPAGWRRDISVPNEQTAWPNSVQPYFMDWRLLAFPGLPQDRIFNSNDYSNANFPWAETSLTMNGLLHQYPVSAVVEPARSPMLWTGLGRVVSEGAALGNPTLKCTNPSAPCIYRATMYPGGTLFWTPRITAWIEEHSLVMASVDGSVRLMPSAGKIQTDSDYSTDPFAGYYSSGEPATIWMDQNGYPIMFKPDFDFNL